MHFWCLLELWKLHAAFCINNEHYQLSNVNTVQSEHYAKKPPLPISKLLAVIYRILSLPISLYL